MDTPFRARDGRPVVTGPLLAHLVEVGRGDAEGGRGVVVVSLAEVLRRRDARAALESRQVRVPLESVVL